MLLTQKIDTLSTSLLDFVLDYLSYPVIVLATLILANARTFFNGDRIRVLIGILDSLSCERQSHVAISKGAFRRTYINKVMLSIASG